jgi:hypothetical protein
VYTKPNRTPDSGFDWLLTVPGVRSTTAVGDAARAVLDATRRAVAAGYAPLLRERVTDNASGE